MKLRTEALPKGGKKRRAYGPSTRYLQASVWAVCLLLSIGLHILALRWLKTALPEAPKREWPAAVVSVLPEPVSSALSFTIWEDPAPLFLPTRWNYASLPTASLEAVVAAAPPLFLPFPPILNLQVASLPQKGTWPGDLQGLFPHSVPKNLTELLGTQSLPSIPYFWNDWGPGPDAPFPSAGLTREKWELKLTVHSLEGNPSRSLPVSAPLREWLGPRLARLEELRLRVFYSTGLDTAPLYLLLDGPAQAEGWLAERGFTQALSRCLAQGYLEPGIYDLRLCWGWSQDNHSNGQ